MQLEEEEEGAMGEVQSQGAQGGFAYPLATRRKTRSAACGGCRATVARGQQVVGLPVWTPACYLCAVREKCNQEKWGADTAFLQR